MLVLLDYGLWIWGSLQEEEKTACTIS